MLPQPRGLTSALVGLGDGALVRRLVGLLLRLDGLLLRFLRDRLRLLGFLRRRLVLVLAGESRGRPDEGRERRSEYQLLHGEPPPAVGRHDEPNLPPWNAPALLPFLQLDL